MATKSTTKHARKSTTSNGHEGRHYVDWIDGRLRDWSRQLRKVETGLQRARTNAGTIAHGVQKDAMDVRRNLDDFVDAAEAIWREVDRTVEKWFTTVRSSLGSKRQSEAATGSARNGRGARVTTRSGRA